jgi:hypothetical protein
VGGRNFILDILRKFTALVFVAVGDVSYADSLADDVVGVLSLSERP